MVSLARSYSGLVAGWEMKASLDVCVDRRESISLFFFNGDSFALLVFSAELEILQVIDVSSSL